MVGWGRGAMLRASSKVLPHGNDRQAQTNLLFQFMMHDSFGDHIRLNRDNISNSNNKSDGSNLNKNNGDEKYMGDGSNLGNNNENNKKKEEGIDLPRKVLSIIGPGADALAKDLYNKTKGLFMCRAVVKMSNMKTTLESILLQVSIERPEPGDDVDDSLGEIQQLISKISKALAYKRYLVVIHDIWEESDWATMQGAFPVDFCFCSRVITTSRRNNVGEACSSYRFDLAYRLEHQGWEEYDAAEVLLRESANLVAAASDDDDEPMNKSCWADCSLYLSTVPEHEKFERNSLVRKWAAEGLVARESVANTYFDELVNRNVISTHPATRHGDIFGDDRSYHVDSGMLKVLRDESQRRGFVTTLVDGAAADSISTPPPRRLMICCTSTRAVNSCITVPAEGREVVDVRSAISVTVHGGRVKAGPVSLEHLQQHLLRVLDLEGCQDVVDTDVADMSRHLTLLRYLSLRSTPVTVIPPDIRNLQDLETLDVRETRLTELPMEVARLRLRKLANLLFSGGVRFPHGRVDAAAEGELVVVLVRGGDSPARAADTSHGHGPSRNLEKLKVAGRYVELPVAWIKQFNNQVSVLDISVCQLNDDDLEALGRMVCLRSLTLSLFLVPTKQIIIISGCATTRTREADAAAEVLLFPSLEFFSLDCRVPWLAFQEKAMPKLQRLCLKLYCAVAVSSKTPSGLIYLQRLLEVTLHYSPHYASTFITSSGTAAGGTIAAAIEKELAVHPRTVTLLLHQQHQRDIPKIQSQGNFYRNFHWCWRNILQCVASPVIRLYHSMTYLSLVGIALILYWLPRLLSSYFLLPHITNRVANDITRRAFSSMPMPLLFSLVFYTRQHLQDNSKWLPVLRFSIFIILCACFSSLYIYAFSTLASVTTLKLIAFPLLFSIVAKHYDSPASNFAGRSFICIAVIAFLCFNRIFFYVYYYTVTWTILSEVIPSLISLPFLILVFCVLTFFVNHFEKILVSSIIPKAARRNQRQGPC